MKKLLLIIFSIQVLIWTFIGLKLTSHFVYNNLFFQEKHAVVLRNESLDNDDFFGSLTFENSQTTISKYIFTNENELTIYTNDTTLDGKIPANHHMKELHSKEFVANYSAKGNLNQFYVYQPGLKITIRPLQDLINVGTDGLYYFSDSANFDSLVKEMNAQNIYAEQYGDAEMSLLSILDDYSEIITCAGLTTLILLSLASYFVISKSKKIAILKVNGYSFTQIIANMARSFKNGGVIVVILGVLGQVVYCLSYGGRQDLPTVVTVYFLLFLLNFLLTSAMFLLVSFLIYRFGTIGSMIKGRKPYKTIQLLNVGLKMIFLAFCLVSVKEIKENVSILNEQYQLMDHWVAAKNVYGIEMKYVGESRDSQQKLADFYSDLDQQGALLIDAQNFDLADGVTPVYEYNAPGERSLYEAAGKSIIVNENYLRKNGVTIDGDEEAVFRKLIYKDNVQNILVPKTLKKYEKLLYQSYLEEFYFKKVEVQALYDENPSNSSIDELKINIIYIDDAQTFFAYTDVNVAEGGLIINPVISVYTQNIDSSYAASVVSRCVFFEYDGPDSYAHIVPTIQKNKVASEIQSVISIYQEKSELIQSIQKQQAYQSIALLIVGSVFFLTSYLLVSSYFEEKSYKLMIQKVHSYSLVQRIYSFLGKFVALDLVIIGTTAYFCEDSTLFYTGLVIVVIDTLFIFVSSHLQDRKNSNQILKGEH
ncbi:hypothetical protein BAU15_01570 [Enterococcus sp. JM4C]|uniref:DUF1430 domain-containing protein n=1 Tax=Candidatus Enterococcus huntleyi TaxID=1857217 RepID=UPI001379846B|nr:DUF1430 domain-containing protein [Enterococcus sp. JM4C]KAF1299362.1 hypothetical protein BAU15_01570 [Enterococcus sp. JM4C]